MNEYKYNPIKMSPFKWFVLENFPFIEEDFDSLTSYGLYCKLKEYFDKVATKTNETGSQVENLTNAFITLKNYVDNYFNNLDVQEEINNKLDTMVTDGTMEAILGAYFLTITKNYDTINDMINDSYLTIGNKCKTLGYYSISDGGSSLYKIIDSTGITPDGSYYIKLDNGLIAELIIENDTINFPQLGAKPNDNTFDCKQYLLNYVNICNNFNKTFELKIPNGKWYFSETHIARVGGVHITGDSSFYGGRGNDYGSQILALNDPQQYIWKFGGSADMNNTTLSYNSTNTSNKISSLTFSSGAKHIQYGCLALEYSNYGVYHDLCFRNIYGTGLYMRSCWENYFDILLFRTIWDFTKPCINFAKTRPITGVASNISSNSFDKIMFEGTSGDMIYLEYGCSFINNQIGEINIENSMALYEGETSSNITEETILDDMHPYYVINGYLTNSVIKDIVITGLNSFEKYATTNFGYYYYKSIINIGDYVSASQTNLTTFTIGNIIERSRNQILSCKSSYAAACSVIINSINGESNDSSPIKYSKFEVDKFGKLLIGNMSTRINTDNLMSPVNEIEFYKFCERGCVSTNVSANNSTKLVAKRNGDATWLVRNLLKYPFNYSEKTKKIFGVKIIPGESGSVFFSVRGIVNGAEVTKSYSRSNLKPLDVIEIEMNFDMGSDIKFFNPSNDMAFVSLYYIREENIT